MKKRDCRLVEFRRRRADYLESRHELGGRKGKERQDGDASRKCVRQPQRRLRHEQVGTLRHAAQHAERGVRELIEQASKFLFDRIDNRTSRIRVDVAMASDRDEQRHPRRHLPGKVGIGVHHARDLANPARQLKFAAAISSGWPRDCAGRGSVCRSAAGFYRFVSVPP